MRQIYYTIRTLLRERGSNIIRIISLSLGLTIGVLLFSQIAFELSYEKCYPEAERLALVRCQMTNLSTGETAGDDGETSYDYTVFDVLASTLAEEMPKEIEVASSVLSMGSANIYYEDKLLPDGVNVMISTLGASTRKVMSKRIWSLPAPVEPWAMASAPISLA